MLIVTTIVTGTGFATGYATGYATRYANRYDTGTNTEHRNDTEHHGWYTKSTSEHSTTYTTAQHRAHTAY